MSTYDIYIDNGDGLKLFYRPNVEDLQLSEIVYTQTIGSAGSLTFKVPFTHPYYNEIEPLKTDIWLFVNGDKMFRGRYVGKSEDYYRTGAITCEGDLNYLVDSLQEPYEHKGSISQFFSTMINAHNAKVEPRKQFKIGRVTVTDNNNYISRSCENYSTTAEALKTKLINTHGGYIHVRYEDDGNYLDYTYDYGGTNSQVVRFAENILDLSKSIDASNIITCLIPIGAQIEDTLETGVNGKVNITSVNGGKNYIEDTEAVAKFGRIWGYKEWSDVTVPANLLTKAREYLTTQIVLPQRFTLTAVDLSLIDNDIESFKLGYYTDVVSAVHDIKGRYLLQQAVTNISNPTQSTITLGGTVTSLSGQLTKTQNNVTQQVETVYSTTDIKINRNAELLRGGLGGYVVMPPNEETGKPEEILIMDTPSKATAQQVLRINKNGIGFSQNGYDGDYGTAWQIDGTFWADYIQAGTMLADRIKGGRLELGGSQAGTYKNGSIYMYDASDNLIGEWNNGGLKVYKGEISGTEISSGNSASNQIFIKNGAITGGYDTYRGGKIEFSEYATYGGVGLKISGNNLDIATSNITVGNYKGQTKRVTYVTGVTLKNSTLTVNTASIDFVNGIMVTA